ncbi:unnamed protein product, partial [Sphenostylis stenocarpa]
MRSFECGGAHFKCNFPNLVEVKTKERRCYICNKPGHFANICPKKKSGSRSQQRKAYGEKPQAAGRVFALSIVEATRSGLNQPGLWLDAIIGMDWLIANHILIDCGQHKVVLGDWVGTRFDSVDSASLEGWSYLLFGDSSREKEECQRGGNRDTSSGR